MSARGRRRRAARPAPQVPQASAGGDLGDVLRAVRALAPRGVHEQVLVARMLGFGPLEVFTTRGAALPSTSKPLGARESEVRAPSASRSTAVDPAVPRGARPLTSRYEHHAAPPSELPAELRDIEPLESSAHDRERGPPPTSSLFDASRWRAVVSSALCTWPRGGEPDVEATVERIASGATLSELPRRALARVAPSVQLLLDRSAAMLPFHEDLADLEQRVRLLVHEPVLSVLGFDSMPLRASGAASRRTWRAYREAHAPTSGTLVLVASDLGIGVAPEGSAPGSVAEWLEFHDFVRAANATLRVLVPYGRERWPVGLRRLPALEWDRSLPVAELVRLVRRARGGPVR